MARSFPPNMTAKYTLIKDLTDTSEGCEIRARVTRKWEFFNFKTNNLVSHDMILLDESVSL